MENRTAKILHVEDYRNDAEMAVRTLLKSHKNNVAILAKGQPDTKRACALGFYWLLKNQPHN